MIHLLANNFRNNSETLMQNKIRNVISRLILGTLCLCVVTACSTVEGVGEDISKAGQVLSDASRKEQGK